MFSSSDGFGWSKLLFSAMCAILLTFCTDVTNGLKNLQISIPQAVVSGGSAVLECTYDLEGDLLYSVKWFRGKTEFYRYVPKENPRTRTFASSGITVDLNNSTDTRVSLINMQRELSDYYRCEVVTDIPKFYTAVGSSYLIVVVPPKSRPQIETDKWKYPYGEVIRANCTSGPAYPGVNITWYRNNEMVKETSETVIAGDVNGLVETIISTLEMDLKPDKYRLECVANQYDVYKESSHYHDIIQEAPESAAIQKNAAATGSRGVIPFSNMLITFLLAMSYWILELV
uniref:Ig-like domain-containing protein n=1 Tax=Cacopsylla melanoneura TaxID=428564 RepID=A0A8D8VZY9_9HEMI